MTDSQLDTAADVTEALGGAAAVAAMTGVGVTAVCNWTATRNFPPDTFVVMSTALAKLGLRAPEHLWKMREAPMALRKGKRSSK